MPDVVDHGCSWWFWIFLGDFALLVVYIQSEETQRAKPKLGEVRREAPPPLEAYEKDPFDFLSINMYPAQAGEWFSMV